MNHERNKKDRHQRSSFKNKKGSPKIQGIEELISTSFANWRWASYGYVYRKLHHAILRNSASNGLLTAKVLAFKIAKLEILVLVACGGADACLLIYNLPH